MGEKKRRMKHKEAELRKIMYQEIKNWDRPATKWESDLIAEINQLPRVKVERPTQEQLTYMRMKPRECHINAGEYARLDTTNESRMVTGWWKQEDRFIHHSIVGRADGVFFCVTPLLVPFEEKMEFIPDDKIEWRDEGETRVAYRNNHEIGPGLRSDVQKARKLNSIIKIALDEGKSTTEAIRLAENTS